MDFRTEVSFSIEQLLHARSEMARYLNEKAYDMASTDTHKLRKTVIYGIDVSLISHESNKYKITIANETSDCIFIDSETKKENINFLPIIDQLILKITIGLIKRIEYKDDLTLVEFIQGCLRHDDYGSLKEIYPQLVITPTIRGYTYFIQRLNGDLVRWVEYRSPKNKPLSENFNFVTSDKIMKDAEYVINNSFSGFRNELDELKIFNYLIEDLATLLILGDYDSELKSRVVGFYYR